MTIFRDIKHCFSFLTRFPVSKNINIDEDVAPKIWLFPIVGFVLGLISSIIGLLLFRFLPLLLVGFIILGSMLFMTGVHHTDGLIDFGDGLMVMGSPERKIKAMHDVAIGAGGFTLAFIVLLLTGIAISYSMSYIIISLVVSEIGAKFGMVAACSFGKSAGTKTVEPFIRFNKKKHLFLSFILSALLIYFTILIISYFNLVYNENYYLKLIFSPHNPISPNDLEQILFIYLIFLLGTFFPLFIILRLANRNFNGLTGDCIGALNEIIRLSILILNILFWSLKII